MGRYIDWTGRRAFRGRTKEGCLVWIGCYDSAGNPVIHFSVDGVRRTINVSRAIMAMTLGRPLLRAEWVKRKCDTDGCCAHLYLTTQSAVHRAAAAKYDWQRTRARSINLARATKRLFTLEQADEMRRAYAEGESWSAITARFKVPPNTLRRILDYTSYVEHIQPNLLQALRRKGSIGYTRREPARHQPERASP